MKLANPKMNIFNGHDELIDFLNDREGNHVVNSRGRIDLLSVEKDVNGYITLAYDGKHLGRFSDWSLRTFCTRMAIPRPYLLSIEDENFAIGIMNQRISEKGSGKKFSIRHDNHENIMVGMTSHTYSYYPNRLLVSDVFSNISNSDEAFNFCQATVWNGNLQATYLSYSNEVNVRKGDVYRAGLRIVNSHDGSSSVRILPTAILVKNVVDGHVFTGAVMHSESYGGRIVHRGSDFELRISKLINESSRKVEKLLGGIKRLAETKSVSNKQWGRIENYMKKRLGASGAKKVISECLPSFNGDFYFIVSASNYEDVAENVAYACEEENLPSFWDGFKLQDDAVLMKTQDFATMIPIKSLGNNSVAIDTNATVEIPKAIVSLLQKIFDEVRPRDAYEFVKNMIDSASSVNEHDVRLDYEIAAGDIASMFAP